MYTMLRKDGLRRDLVVEGPALVVSMAVAELFYKFHSFVLECGAFLVTWYAVSWAVSLVRRRAASQEQARP